MEAQLHKDDRLISILSLAMQRPVEERDVFLRAECAEEEELYLQVRDALDAEERMGNFLREPLINLATLVRPFEAQQVIAERFEILREIGEGGMGVVYEAFDRRLQQRIAIKAAKPGFQRLLSPELKGALHVRHHNICMMNEIHTAETQYGEIDFLTMEFLDGETLSAHLAKVGKLAHEEALDIAEQLCAGVAEAHRSGILHRDLKCANVFLSKNEDGSRRTVIMDFGLATRMDLADAESGGTPDYMAPELWKGEPASRVSDIYALGVIFYEMVAGRRPCGREAKQKPLADKPSGANGHPPSASGNGSPAASLWIGEKRWREKQFTPRSLPPSAWAHGLDSRWDRVTMGCLAASPTERTQDVNEVLTELKREPVRKWPFVTAALLLLVLTTVVGLVPPLRHWAADFIWPPNVRLAVLPFDGPKNLSAIGEGALQNAAENIQQLPGDRKWPLNKLSRSVLVIPPSRVASAHATTPKLAGELLHATHALKVTVQPEEDGKISAHASVVDLKSQLSVKEWSGKYEPTDLGAMSTALSRFAAMTFRLREPSSADRLSAAAMESYLKGTYFLNRDTYSYEEAMTSFQEAARLDPSSALPPAAMAIAMLQKFDSTKQQNDLQQAQEYVAMAQSRNPDSARVLLASGRVNKANHFYNRALQDYRRMLELDPRNIDALLGIAGVYEQLDEPQEVMDAIRKAQEIDPEYYRSYQLLAAFYADGGHFSEAAEQFRKAISLAPGFIDNYSGLAAMLIALERYGEAEQALKKSLEIRETPMALNNMGALMTFQRRFEDAAAYQRRAMMYEPNNYYWILNLADDLRWAGHSAEAGPYYRRGRDLALEDITAHPGSADARAIYAYFLARLGDHDRADQEIKQALNLAPSETDLWRRAVMTYEAAGQRDQALAAAKRLTGSELKLLTREPDLADFGQDPRFKQLMADKGGH